MVRKASFLLLVLTILFSGNLFANDSKKHLLVYCGITMIKPMQEIAHIIEKEQGVKITLIQGGSEDLYQSLKASRQGDLYLPGSQSYRDKHLEEGLLDENVHVGYNKAAMVVAKGNPKNIPNSLESLLDPSYAVVICNPESGSIGRETKKILDQADMFMDVIDNTVFLTTDSRNLNRAIIEKKADVTINWYATSLWPENIGHLEAMHIDPKLVKRKKLILNLLKFSKHPKVARRFMEYAAGPKGQDIFLKYGFWEKGDLADKK